MSLILRPAPNLLKSSSKLEAKGNLSCSFKIVLNFPFWGSVLNTKKKIVSLTDKHNPMNLSLNTTSASTIIWSMGIVMRIVQKFTKQSILTSLKDIHKFTKKKRDSKIITMTLTVNNHTLPRLKVCMRGTGEQQTENLKLVRRITLLTRVFCLRVSLVVPTTILPIRKELMAIQVPRVIRMYWGKRA